MKTRNRSSESKTGNSEPQQNYRLERSVMKYWGLKLVLSAQPHPQFLQWYKTFSWLFVSHDNPPTRHGNLIKIAVPFSICLVKLFGLNLYVKG